MKRTAAIVLLLMLLCAAFAEPMGATGWTLTVPEGYSLTNEGTDDDPEYYLKPDDVGSAVRFLYFTTSSGDYRAMAESASKGYAAFYDSYEGVDVHDATYAGRDVATFSYICSYQNEAETATVYEETAICYLPTKDDAFIAFIVSAVADSEEGLPDEAAMTGLLELAASSLSE